MHTALIPLAPIMMAVAKYTISTSDGILEAVKMIKKAKYLIHAKPDV
jgi:hypothetical protein